MSYGQVKTHVPYLSRHALDSQAALLLHEYGLEYRPVTAPPVPIDAILENFLKLTFSFMDLRAIFRAADVDGALWMERGEVGVDQRLDPDADPRKEGRYNFTLAHEIGHWQLHRNLPAAPADPLLPFSDRAAVRPTYICRSNARNRVEIQANGYASSLLMPEPMVFAAWRRFHGVESMTLEELRQRGLTASEVNGLIQQGWFPTDENQYTASVVKSVVGPLAGLFHVSLQAMRIRLEELGLLPRISLRLLR